MQIPSYEPTDPPATSEGGAWTEPPVADGGGVSLPDTVIEPPPPAGDDRAGTDISSPTDNQPPVALTADYEVNRNVSTTISLGGSDSDGDMLSFRIVSPPTRGQLGLTSKSPRSGRLVYTPETGYTGTDWFSFSVSDGVHESSPATVAITVMDDYQPPLLGSRSPQWPLKTSRTLHTPAQIADAQTFCSTIMDGLALRGRVLTAAGPWAIKSDEALRTLLPDARVCRAQDVSAKGCPVHGTAIYQHGTYPWKLDSQDPFVVICPIGQERYPDNDFGAYYDSDLRDPRLRVGNYADNGRGWVAPDGEKYWFVAYACHWNWKNVWLPAVTSLSQAYALTGNRTYARKAIVMLDRIAEVYPGMNYAAQSRLGELLGGAYPGKIQNAIWEAAAFRDLAIAYDLVFDTLIGPDAISLPWRSSAQIRANIEANLLEEGIAAVALKKIAGNFGMHQGALAYAVVTRQNGPSQELLNGIFENTGGSIEQEGLNYALYNLIYKDGLPFETSPYYCFTWVDSFAKLAKPLALAGYDLYDSPRMQAMLDAPLQLLCTSAFTPANGDAGTITSRWIGPTPAPYKAGYLNLGEPAYAWALSKLNSLTNWIYYFDELFEGVIPLNVAQPAAASYDTRLPSRLFDGYGMAILNNQQDSLAVSLNYGLRGYHGHNDRLNLEIFGRGRRLSPDLGYPDFMNGFIPGIYSWTMNTLSHNCLMVDEKKQLGNTAGQVLRFHDTPTVHVVDVDAAGAYSHADVYRRTLVLVDVGNDDGYLVDVFRVRGGADHVFSIHGQEAAFQFTGATLPAPVTQGTLAGPNVAYGQLYDDATMGSPNYKGQYVNYAGSGYQHLFNWQAVLPASTVTAIWRAVDDPNIQLRVHVPPYPGQEVVVADAYVSPTRKIPTILKYLLCRRDAGADGNTFVAVWEMTGGTPIINSVALHAVTPTTGGCNQVVALSVNRGSATDTLAVAPAPGTAYSFTKTAPTVGTVASNAAVLLVTEAAGVRTRTFAAGGSSLTCSLPSQVVSIPSTVTGSIIGVNYGSRTIEVGASVSAATAASLVGRTVRIFNDRHSCVYTVASAASAAGRLTLQLAGSDVFTGRVRIQAVDTDNLSIQTNTRILCPQNLAGMSLVTEDLSHAETILDMYDDQIILSDEADLEPFAQGVGGPQATDAWIADFGVNDQVQIEPNVYQVP